MFFSKVREFLSMCTFGKLSFKEKIFATLSLGWIILLDILPGGTV